VLIGAMVITAAVSSSYALALAAVAMAFAAMNVVGGYVVTDRMLHMFLRRPAAASAAPGRKHDDLHGGKEAAAR
jgi:NAD(P) transhydrogenase subunit alpha